MTRPALILALTLSILTLVTAAPAAEPRGGSSRIMAGWFNVTTPDGWTGRRYMDGQEVFAEEFDSDRDGRLDVWRFYRRGMLSSEERDTNSNGRVDFQSRWEARDGKLLSVLRDTAHRGVNDLEIDATGPRTWEVREDRNLDGISDRILFVDAPADLFEYIGLDLSVQRDVINSIPPEYWAELWTDDGFTGNITSYSRYTDGVVSHYGSWDGSQLVWSRGVPADMLAAAPAPAGPVAGRATAPPGTAPAIPPSAAVAAGPAAPIRGEAFSPDQLAAADPFAVGAAEAEQFAADPFAAGAATDPFATDPFAAGATPGLYPGAPIGTAAGARDRTRYAEMPPGDSAARSIPARMRPPGASPRQ